MLPADRPVGRSGREAPLTKTESTIRKIGTAGARRHFGRRNPSENGDNDSARLLLHERPFFSADGLVILRRELRMRTFVRIMAGAAFLALLPGVVSAQGTSTISGVVRDASGAVLPGVTVEAASPALIEKVRSVTTDGSGQYAIIQLRPGIYTVTFTLAGLQHREARRRRAHRGLHRDDQRRARRSARSRRRLRSPLNRRSSTCRASRHARS